MGLTPFHCKCSNLYWQICHSFTTMQHTKINAFNKTYTQRARWVSTICRTALSRKSSDRCMRQTTSKVPVPVYVTHTQAHTHTHKHTHTHTYTHIHTHAHTHARTHAHTHTHSLTHTHTHVAAGRMLTAASPVSDSVFIDFTPV